MPGEYYFGDRPDESGSLIRKILIWICTAALIAAAAVFGWLYVYNRQLSSVLPSFENALENHEYTKALTMYRDIQAEVLGRDPDDTKTDPKEKEVLAEMESIVYARVDSIEASIRNDRYTPAADDRAFLEQMGELTGARLSLWLESLCGEFLLGTIEKPALEFIFGQVGDYTNIVSSAAPLKKELDSIEIYRGDVQTAEQYFASKSYIEAVDKYEDIISHTTGFVNKYASARLSDCEKEMYDPIMAQCDELLLSYQYYTAENILSDLARIFPDDQKVQAKLLEATSNTSIVVNYTDKVEVLCVKPLIADADLAFRAENNGNTDSLMLTTSEFKAILEQLYTNNYILVDIHNMVDLSSESNVSQLAFKIPEGKKPLVIILENVNYSAYQTGLGISSKLVLNDQNQVCAEYVNASGQTVTSRDAEAIGILDAFVDQHPDFSFNGAKGIVAFTGYETVMGYITNADQVDDRNAALSAMGAVSISPTEAEISSNREAVAAIMDRLKETGWSLASSTYGFINANDCDMDTIQNDTNKWIDQVSSLTGKADILVYPNGNFIKGADPRAVFLKENGFRIFFGVGPTPYYTFGNNYLYLDRTMLNGDTLRSLSFEGIFDAREVYDTKRTKPFS